MPKLHDFRADFRMGRTGDGLRVNQQTRAYSASVFNAQNMMVTADGKIARRWGTLIRNTLTDEARIEAWVYEHSDEAQFILVFGNTTLDVYDMVDLTTPVAAFTGQPWTDTTKWFLTFTSEGNRLIIADTSFKPRILEVDPNDYSMTIAELAFASTYDGTRLLAPFYPFVGEDTSATFTCYTSPGQATGYGPHIAQALGISPTSFDLAAGTGEMTVSTDFLTADHVGTRMRVGPKGEGEIEITAVNSGTSADIEVHRDLAVKLDTDPFFIRKTSAIVEVAAPEHNLSVGDNVFFFGLSTTTGDEATNILRDAPLYCSNGTSTTTASGTASTYTVSRIVDENHFEVIGDAATATVDGLHGGSDVYMIPATGLRNVREPVFSAARGWPQACAMHESRLVLAGTQILPDAAWASRPNNIRDFDPGEGNPDEAVVMYGIGDQVRVRHLVSSFDLIILTDKGEFYVPGSTDTAMTQETVRAVPSTAHGAAYTRPQLFDGSVYFVDTPGANVREMLLKDGAAGYTAPPASSVVSDWVKEPKHAARYEGSPSRVTPYVLFSGSTDGAILVMHSSRNDEAFGFMRWTLNGESFISTACVKSRIFAVATRAGGYVLLEFDTEENGVSTDFSEELIPSDPGVYPTTYRAAAEDLVAYTADQLFYDVTTNAGAEIEIEGLTEDIIAGDYMPWHVEMNAPIAGSGQGPKIGKMQNLVSAEINWDETQTGEVHGLEVIEPADLTDVGAPIAVDEWRQYHIGEWDREPRMLISGQAPGAVAIRAMVLNVYF